MKSTLRLLGLAAVLASAVAASAQNVVINVAFRLDPYTGASAYEGSSSGDIWNAWGAPNGGAPIWTLDNLGDVNGNTTAVSVVAISDTGQIWQGGISGNGISLFDAYWHAAGPGNMHFFITGLSANYSYDLIVYGGRRTDWWEHPIGPETQSFTLGSTTYQTSYNGTQDAFVALQNYVRFSNVSANSGYLSFFTPNLPNGFTLVGTPIPEPSTYAALAGALALGLVMLRRRRALAA